MASSGVRFKFRFLHFDSEPATGCQRGRGASRDSCGLVRVRLLGAFPMPAGNLPRRVPVDSQSEESPTRMHAIPLPTSQGLLFKEMAHWQHLLSSLHWAL